MDNTTSMGHNNKQLVVLYPSAGMGHLVSMIELGKLFADRGLAVTIIVTDLPYNNGISAHFLTDVSVANPWLFFHHLPHVSLPTSSSPMLELVMFELPLLVNPLLHAYLHDVSPKPVALVLDFFCSCAVDVAAELDIPAYFFYTTCANSLASFLYQPVLHEQSTKSYRDRSTDLLHVPGIPPLPANHMPVGLLDRTNGVYDHFLATSERLAASHGIIVNTFRSLESSALDAIAAGLCTPPGRPTPSVYCIGPLIKAEEISKKRGDKCISWLDSQPKGSVVFLCFGSIGRFSAEQIKLVAIGLERSGHRFLWVVRSPPSDDPLKKFEQLPEPDFDVLLPEGFLERTKYQGLIVKSWAPQRDVLSHEAVGGFMTHCGWNSVLEAIVMGVPMAAWPLYAEQWMNKVFLVEEMKLAVAVEGYDKEVVAAEEVEAKVKWIMESDGGRELRKRMAVAREWARQALADGGESKLALEEIVEGWKTDVVSLIRSEEKLVSAVADAA